MTEKQMVIIIKQEEKDGVISTSREVVGDDLEKVEQLHWLDKFIDDFKRRFK